MKNYHFIYLVSLFSFSFLAGCSSGESIKNSAYGDDAYKVKCKNTPEACLEEAYKKCNGETYTTLYSDSHAGGILADLIPGPTTWYALTFKCGGVGTKPNFPWTGTTIKEAVETIKVLEGIGNSINENNFNSRIEDEFEGYEYGNLYRLTNGEVWEQTSATYKYKYKFRPRVAISNGNLFVEGMSQSVSVRRYY